MRNPTDSNFCYYPFSQILLSADGQYKPCSKHRDVITHEGKILNTTNATLEDAWTSDYMVEMRESFNSNRQFAGCSECWRMQKMGLRSMRYDSYQYTVTEAQVANPVSPIRIELNSSNVCNLKCRICSPNASTKWITEFKKFYNSDQGIHINLNEENLRQVKGWADNLEEICFFGGEPLLFNENIELLEYLIERGLAQGIDLLFNTNGTVFSDKIAIMLSRFKRVRVSFSIDDIGPRFEYQRSNAKWPKVEENLKSAYRYSLLPEWNNVELKICQSLSTLNAYYLPEFFNYFNAQFPGLVVYWNLIYHPWEFNVQILPQAAKEAIKQRWKAEIKTTFKLSHDETKTIDDLITYMEYDEQKDFAEFFRTTNRHDVYRVENYAAVFPEFWQIIKQYQPDDLVMGQYDPADDWIKRSEKYESGTDYAAKIKSRLEAYLIKKHPAKSIAGLTEDFFKRFEKITGSPGNLQDRNLIFYLMNLSRIKDVYEDVAVTSDDILISRLSTHIAEYFYTDPNTYYTEVDYHQVISVQAKKFLMRMYNEQQSDKLTNEFDNKLQLKLTDYKDRDGLNLAYFAMVRMPIEELYNDAIGNDATRFLDRLACLKTEYSYQNQHIYHPELNYSKIISTQVNKFLEETKDGRQADELIKLFQAKAEARIADYDGPGNQNMTYFIMMRTPIDQLYEDVLADNYVPLVDRLLQHKSDYYYQNKQAYTTQKDYAAEVKKDMEKYLQLTHGVESGRMTQAFMDRIIQFTTPDQRNYVMYLIAHSPINKVIEDMMSMSDQELSIKLEEVLAGTEGANV